MIVWLRGLLRKIKSWIAKHLSYTGRVQIVNYVLFSMAAYWCSQIILPKKVIYLVNQRCRAFIWKDTSEYKGGGNISRREVCLTKSEGGLRV